MQYPEPQKKFSFVFQISVLKHKDDHNNNISAPFYESLVFIFKYCAITDNINV